MPVGFSFVDIGDVNFDDGRLYGRNSIGNGQRRVGVGTGIEDDTVVAEAHFMQFVYDCPFVVALKVVNMKAGEAASEVEEKILKAVIAIDFGLPLAEEVEVGAIDDDDFHSV